MRATSSRPRASDSARWEWSWPARCAACPPSAPPPPLRAPLPPPRRGGAAAARSRARRARRARRRQRPLRAVHLPALAAGADPDQQPHGRARLAATRAARLGPGHRARQPCLRAGQPPRAPRPARDPRPQPLRGTVGVAARARGRVLRGVRQPAARALRGDGVRAAAGTRRRGGPRVPRDPRAPLRLVPDRAALLGGGRRAALARARTRNRVRGGARLRGHALRGAVPRGRGGAARLGRPPPLGQALVRGGRGSRAALSTLAGLRRRARAARSRRALRQPLDRAHAGRLRADRRVTGRQRWTLAAVCVSTALLLVNVAAPNVALAAIARDLDASFTDLLWVLGGYALVLAVFQLTAGSLADLFGRKRLFVGGLCLFTIASALCALAPSAGALIAARLLQGLGAAIIFPSSLGLLAQEFEGAQRGRAIGIWGAVIGLAFAAGPLVGGLLVGPFGWQAIFGLGFVLGVPTTVLAVLQVRESRDPDPKPVDGWGVATLSVGLFLLVYAVLRGNALGWTSGAVLGLAAGGVGFLAAFAVVELRAASPMLDLRLFRNRTFLGATVIVATLAGGAFGAFVYISLFLLDVRRGSPVEVGLWLAPLAIVAFVVSLGAGRLSDRLPLRGALAGGMALCAAGLVLMTGVDAGSSWTHLLAGLVVVGAGTGLANPLVTFTHLGVLPPAHGGL